MAAKATLALRTMCAIGMAANPLKQPLMRPIKQLLDQCLLCADFAFQFADP